MAIEEQLLTFALNNGAGVLGMVLLWIMGNSSIKENTKSNIELREAVIKLSEKIGSRPN